MISVIVPVYKVEKYLNKCVQSILAQTYKDFELILVDDGSPDNCPKMCDEYAQIDKRVKVIHKTNGGLSDARNTGTAFAKGDFITYVDSDDYVSIEYLERLIYLQKKYKADISVVGIGIYREGKKPKNILSNKEYIYSGEEALLKMLYQDTLDSSACAILLPATVAKLFSFPVGKYHEDEFTTYKYYSSVGRVVVTSQTHYFYLQREGSIMHTFGQSSLDELDAADNLVEFCQNNYSELVRAAESKKFSDYCQVLLNSNDLKKMFPETYVRICSYLDESKYKIAIDNKCRVKNRVAALLCILNRELMIKTWKMVKN